MVDRCREIDRCIEEGASRIQKHLDRINKPPVFTIQFKLTHFRVKELKDVLTSLRLSKQGKKQDLVDRILAACGALLFCGIAICGALFYTSFWDHFCISIFPPKWQFSLQILLLTEITAILDDEILDLIQFESLEDTPEEEIYGYTLMDEQNNDQVVVKANQECTVDLDDICGSLVDMRMKTVD